MNSKIANRIRRVNSYRPSPRGRDILIFGFPSGVLIAVLKLPEYRFLVVEHSVEIYGGLPRERYDTILNEPSSKNERVGGSEAHKRAAPPRVE